MIIKCPACEHDVSDKAIRCNKCGEPINGNADTTATTTKGNSTAILSYIIMALALIIGIIMFVRELQYYTSLNDQLELYIQFQEARMNMIRGMLGMDGI